MVRALRLPAPALLRHDAVEDAVREQALANGKDLLLLEANVLGEQRGERAEAAGVASARGEQILADEAVVAQQPIGERDPARVAGRAQRGYEEPLLDLEVREQSR
ncbi:MAG: hypothetical protein JWM74_2979, partial [Myxococcaceae bacterium]|nr:hypothetical protein [Myxococcaceae bacterium]